MSAEKPDNPPEFKKPVVFSGPNHLLFVKDLKHHELLLALTVQEARRLAVDLLTVAQHVDEAIEADREHARYKRRVEDRKYGE